MLWTYFSSVWLTALSLPSLLIWPALYVHLTPWYVVLVMCYIAFMVIVESVRYRI